MSKLLVELPELKKETNKQKIQLDSVKKKGKEPKKTPGKRRAAGP